MNQGYLAVSIGTAGTTTTTLFDTTADPGTGITAKRKGAGARYSRAICTLTPTVDSGAGGYKIQSSVDAGVTWITQNGAGTGQTLSAGTTYDMDHLIQFPDWRITYTTAGTANVPCSLLVNTDDRSAGV